MDLFEFVLISKMEVDESSQCKEIVRNQTELFDSVLISKMEVDDYSHSQL